MKYQTSLKHNMQLIDLTALVDVVFLLLIFFLVTSDILPVKSMSVEQPDMELDSLPLTSQMVVVMDQEHNLFVGHKPASNVKEQLREQLADIRTRTPKARPTIVMTVDQSVDYGTFLKLLHDVQDLGLTIRLSYKTKYAPVSE